ncbi:MAG TPA: dihydrofolate reductase family protein [Thermoanaerobaculia bacterium]|jgi:dihydrofolate reductase|nr:dihydrofolate reductase family protein [Thermoanaerobaculia bacterium]
MGKVSVFLHLTLDGFYAGPNGEIDWFKSIGQDPEYDAYTHGESEAGNTLIFGRTTYEMMKSWWPTPAAIAADPKMAAVVNESPKIVFSRKLKAVEEAPNWKNITLRHEIDPGHVRTLKAKGDLTILGSGSIVQQFANLRLIEEYALIVVPLVLGRGKSLFEGIEKSDVQLLESRSFRNGLVLLRYKPA